MYAYFTTKRRTGLPVAALAGALLLAGCGKSDKSYKVEPLKVATETVSASAALGSRSYVGKVEEESSTPVSFTGMGAVTRVHVEEGQRVARGQLIAEMDPTQCENALATAKALLDQAQDAQKRMQVLHDAQSISEVDWVDVCTKLRAAQSNCQMAEKALKDCRLTAPCSGIIGKKQMESGMTALPSQPVCNILDITRVKVKVSVPEKEIGLFSPAEAGNVQDAVITAEALPGKTFRPTRYVRSVQGDALTHSYDVRFSVPNPDGLLLPGMVVGVRLTEEGGAQQNVITVPLRCVQQGADGKHFVWLMREGKACRQGVVTGNTQGDRIIIAEGLAQGDRVIVEGYQKVSEGSEVMP